jgi:chromosome segregation ATPase
MTHPADCPTCACDPTPMPYAEARDVADRGVAGRLPTGFRTTAALCTELDDRDRAYVKLGRAHAAALADADTANRGRDELNDRVGALTDELSEAQHDRQVLATENGSMRDELDALRQERDGLVRERDQTTDELVDAVRKLDAARRELAAAESRDHERTRQAMLMLDQARDGGV